MAWAQKYAAREAKWAGHHSLYEAMVYDLTATSNRRYPYWLEEEQPIGLRFVREDKSEHDREYVDKIFILMYPSFSPANSPLIFSLQV